MPVMFKRSVFRTGNSYRITIPMPIVETLGLERKEEMEIWLDENDRIIIQQKRKVE